MLFNGSFTNRHPKKQYHLWYYQKKMLPLWSGGVVIWLFSCLVGSNDYPRPANKPTNQQTNQTTNQTTNQPNNQKI